MCWNSAHAHLLDMMLLLKILMMLIDFAARECDHRHKGDSDHSSGPVLLSFCLFQFSSCLGYIATACMDAGTQKYRC